MSRRHFAAPLALAALCAFSSRPANAVPIDGTLDPAYGPPLVTQTTQSTIKPYPIGQIDYSVASELDGGYGYIDAGVLHLFLAGNLDFWWNIEGITNWLPIDVFIDSGPGGQNQLLATNPTIDMFYDLKNLAGLTFDTAFAPDYWLSLGSNVYGFPNLYAYYATLPSAGSGTGAFLGNTLCGGPGTLSGGTNPFGIQVAVNDSNSLGVSAGCGPSSGVGVGTGIEWAIPLAAIGNPSGCVNVSVFACRQLHDYVLNQVLGPLPPGSCDPGPAAAVNFANLAGNQYFTVCPSGYTPSHRTTWGALKTIYH